MAQESRSNACSVCKRWNDKLASSKVAWYACDACELLGVENWIHASCATQIEFIDGVTTSAIGNTDIQKLFFVCCPQCAKLYGNGKEVLVNEYLNPPNIVLFKSKKYRNLSTLGKRVFGNETRYENYFRKYATPRSILPDGFNLDVWEAKGINDVRMV